MIRKILLGNEPKSEEHVIGPLQKSIGNIKSIWHNEHQDDHGIEKIIRLFLASSQLLFPGIYIKNMANRKGRHYKDLVTDLYVLFKVCFPLYILNSEWHHNILIVALMVYLLMETVLYIPTLIFASDLLAKPHSYRRSMMLLFFNYLEIILAFAVLYTNGDYLNKPFEHWFDAVYFSVITSSSIGFGDYYPVTTYGKFLVSTQALLYLFFVILFLNFFTTRVKTKGYFDHES